MPLLWLASAFLAGVGLGSVLGCPARGWGGLLLLSVGLASPGGAATPAAGRMLAFGPPLPTVEPAALVGSYGELATALRAPSGWTILLGGANQPATSR